jgi:hypothetical protein
MPSQWALQYFEPSVGTQLQAGFAHFLALAICPPSLVCTADKLTTGLGALYAEISIQPNSKSIDSSRDDKIIP